MARSAFGGGGDYSALFGSLYAQSKALKEQQQSSFDKDAFDRWKNGLSSDDDWLAYIQTRVDATASDKDPTDHQHWIQLQRQYVASIADSQAEYAYSEGDASINELIAYYQGRLGRLQEDSEEYRQLKGHLNDLVDKRDSEDLSTGAQEISGRIEQGQATYEDLLRFYRERLAGLRPGSDLHKQVSAEIEKVKGTIADTKLAGEFERLKYLYESKQLSGKSYAARLTSMAQRYKESDPQRYYQILEAANRVRRTGSGGGSSPWTKKERTLEDQLRAVDNYLDLFSNAYKSGARVIPDPARPGQQVVLTPELMTEIDTQRLANYDKLAALYKSNKDSYHYTSTLEKKTKYIVDFVQPHNTIDASQQWGQLVGAAQKQIAATANNPDPEQSFRKVVQAFQSMDTWLKGQVVQGGQVVAAEDQPTGDFLTNSSDFVSQALAILGDPEMESTARMAALDALAASLATDSGANYDKGTQKAMRDLLSQAGAVASGAYDLASGKMVLAITPEDGIKLVPTRVQHILGADPATGQPMNVDVAVPDLPTANGQRVQEVWIDRNGQPTKVYAVVDTAPSPYRAWVATKGVNLGGKSYAAGALIPSSAMTGAAWQSAVAAGAVERRDAFAAKGSPLNYIQIPEYDDNGTHHDAVTWYQDPSTKLWYMGQPPISSAGLNPDGTVQVGADGKLALNWMPLAHVGGVASPYVGSNRRAMQDLYNQGQVGSDPLYNQPQAGYRDSVGNLTTDPSTVPQGSGMYFDPGDESVRGDRYDAFLRDRVFRARKSDKPLLPTEAPSDELMDSRIQKMAEGLGINLGGPLSRPNMTRPKGSAIPGPTAAILEARRQTLVKNNAPKIGLAAGDLELPPSARMTSSGPALANLPTSTRPSIDASKVVAAPMSPKKPAAASTSTAAKLPDFTAPDLRDSYIQRRTGGF